MTVYLNPANWRIFGGGAAPVPPANPVGDNPPVGGPPGGQGGIGDGLNVLEKAKELDPLADPHAAELAAKAALAQAGGGPNPLEGPDKVHQQPPPQFPPPNDPPKEEEWYVSAWNSFTTFWSSAWDSVCTTLTSWYESICAWCKGSS